MNSLYNINYSQLTRGASKGVTNPSTEPVFVRVVDIILDDTHPEWTKYGQTDSIGVIKYKHITKDISEDNPRELPTAYPIHTSYKHYPLKNELVILINAPNTNLNESANSRRTYYTTIINLWNHPNHNAYPQDTSADIDLGNGIIENTNINPLQPFSGDILIEGRLGQSIRFSGNHTTKANFITPGVPITIISNGRPPKNQPYELTVEDINQDAASIWLTTNHKIPIRLANEKKDSYKEAPTEADKYKGSGVYINSDRIVVNAKSDSIITSAKDSIALAADRIHVDGVKQIVLDADKIFLGKDSYKADDISREPVLKGNQVEFYLEQLTKALSELATDLGNCTTVDGKAIPLLNIRGPQLLGILRALTAQTNPNGRSSLKSNTVYIE